MSETHSATCLPAVLAPSHEEMPSQDRHFRVEHLKSDLRVRAVRGGAVTLGAQSARLILQMGVTAVLARLLTPADCGLIAMVTAVTGCAELFKDLGLSQATVQRTEITHEQVNTLFWINVAASAVLSLLVTALAPFVAMFYHEPQLTWVTVAFGGTCLFGGLAAQHTALLQRQMLFGRLAMIDLASLIAGGIAGIIMAALGARYWSLVGMTAVQAAARALGPWLAGGWRPGRPRWDPGVRPMLAFGGHLTGFNLVNYLSRNADNILIGWWWGPAPLGLYAKAYSLLLLPVRQINGPATSVVVPSLSRLQHDPDRFRQYYCTAMALMSFVSMPVCAFCLVAAEPVILVFLGPQWIEAAPIFCALGPAALAGAINTANGWLLTALGRTDRQLRYGCVLAMVLVSAFLCGLPWGPKGVALAYSVAFVASRVPSWLFCFRGTPVRVADLLIAIWHPLCASLLAGVSTFALDRLLWTDSHAAIRLMAEWGVFCATYLSAWLILPGGWGGGCAESPRSFPGSHG